MKVLPSIALAFLVSFPASSFGEDNYKVLGNYKVLNYLVEDVSENSAGVTREDLERTLKLRLMKNGIKPITDLGNKHYLYLNVTVTNIRGDYAAYVSVQLKKFSRHYVTPGHGASSDHLPYVFLSSQNSAIIVGSTKLYLLEQVEEEIDAFVLKYLEANME